MLRATLLILSFFMASFYLGGQDGYTDSLKQAIENTPDDSTRIQLLIDLAANYYRTDPAQAVELGKQARDIAQGQNLKMQLGYSYKTIGLGYLFLPDYLEALFAWQQALTTFQAIGHRSGISNMLNNIGVIYLNQGDDENAISYFLESLKVAEEINDSLRIATALVNIGAVYAHKQDTYEMAKEYYLRSLPISEALGDFDAYGTVCVNLGEIYLADANDEDALKYLEKALDAYKESATGNVPYALNSIGKVYAYRGDYETAIAYHQQSYELAESNGAVLEMAQALLELAEIEVVKGNSKKAITLYKRADSLSRSIDARNDLIFIFQGIASTYARLGQYKPAYEYIISLDSLKTIVYNAEMDKKLQTKTLQYDVEKRQAQIDLQEVVIQRQKTVRNASWIVGALILLLAIGLYSRYRFTKRTNKIIAFEKERSDKLLLNILPEETAEELKNKGSATPKYYTKVSVLFTDFKGFTKIAEKLTPAELVEELNNCFLEFDKIIDKYNLEKIKTIGDAYMCAGGIPVANDSNPIDIVHAGLEIKDYMEKLKRDREAAGQDYWELRIGIHTGAVVAGVVGKNKFAYDIWGDAVNTASRMESSGIPGKVNISGDTYELIRDHFDCTHRGKIQAKNKGEIDMYIVENVKEEIPAQPD